MSVGGTGNGNAYCVKEDQAEHRLSSHQEEQFEPLERAVIAQIVPVSAKNSTLQLTPPAEDGTEENLKKPTKAAKKKARMKPSAKVSFLAISIQAVHAKTDQCTDIITHRC